MNAYTKNVPYASNQSVTYGLLFSATVSTHLVTENDLNNVWLNSENFDIMNFGPAITSDNIAPITNDIIKLVTPSGVFDNIFLYFSLYFFR